MFGEGASGQHLNRGPCIGDHARGADAVAIAAVTRATLARAGCSEYQRMGALAVSTTPRELSIAEPLAACRFEELRWAGGRTND